MAVGDGIHVRQHNAGPILARRRLVHQALVHELRHFRFCQTHARRYAGHVFLRAAPQNVGKALRELAARELVIYRKPTDDYSAVVFDGTVVTVRSQIREIDQLLLWVSSSLSAVYHLGGCFRAVLSTDRKLVTDT